MRRKTVTFFVVLLALVVPLNARAQPTVTINGSAVPVILSAPATVSVKVTGASRQVTDDWVGLYLVGAPNEPRGDWQYLNGLQTPPTKGLRTATLTFVLPTVGTYEARFVVNDAVVATSVPVTVQGIVPSAPPQSATWVLSLTKTGTGTGTVSGGGTYVTGTVVTITAMSSSDSSFGGWQGGSTCASGQVTMVANIGCTAVFTLYASSPPPPTSTSTGKAYYFSPSGYDSSGCLSPGTACRSIVKVNAMTFSAGDQILFEGGSTFSGVLYFAPGKGGTAANPITVASYGTGRATIDGGTNTAFFAWDTAGLKLQNLIFKGAGIGVNAAGKGGGVVFYNDLAGDVILSGITLDQVEVTGFGAIANADGTKRGGHGIAVVAWNGLSGYDGIRITNSTIHDNGAEGLKMAGPSNSVVLRNIYLGYLTLHHNMGRTTVADTNQYSGGGIVVYNASTVTIEHCLIYENGATGNGTAGIMVAEGDHALIQFNTVHHNRTGGNADGDGIDLDGGTWNSIVQYNYTYNNDGAGILLAQPAYERGHQRNVIRYNISENDGGKWKYGAIHLWNGGGGIDDTDFYGNTIFSDPAHGGTTNLIRFDGAATTNTRFRNNIFQGTAGVAMLLAPAQGGLIFQGNDYWSGGPFQISYAGASYTNLSAWQVTGQEQLNGAATGRSVDPMLMSPGSETSAGYRLMNGSPMVDAGIDLSMLGINAGARDYFGDVSPQGGFDIGADEAGSAL